MTNKFTASEVHRLSNRIPRSNDEIADAQEALRAFADMLEAREKAAPVAITCYGDDDERNGYIRTKKTLPTDMKLYAHPAPSDAERLAEALRQIAVTTKGYPNASREGEIAIKALAAHSTQDQPPAASVTDVRSVFFGTVNVTWRQDAESPYKWRLIESRLAAQENPNG